MEELIIRAKSGDNSALEEIFNNYKGAVRAIANKYFLVGGNKDDLLQEGMLGLYFAIINYDENKGSFPSFVKLCVLRKIIDAVKQDSSDKNKPLIGCLDISIAENLTDDRTPLSSLVEKEYAQKINKIIAEELTPSEQQVINLFAEGYSLKAISAKLNKSFKAVDSALQRARKKLLKFKE